MATFTITFADGREEQITGEYSFAAGSALAITTGTRTTHYSAAAWFSVTEDQDRLANALAGLRID